MIMMLKRILDKIKFLFKRKAKRGRPSKKRPF